MHDCKIGTHYLFLIKSTQNQLIIVLIVITDIVNCSTLFELPNATQLDDIPAMLTLRSKNSSVSSLHNRFFSRIFKESLEFPKAMAAVGLSSVIVHKHWATRETSLQKSNLTSPLYVWENRALNLQVHERQMPCRKFYSIRQWRKMNLAILKLWCMMLLLKYECMKTWTEEVKTQNLGKKFNLGLSSVPELWRSCSLLGQHDITSKVRNMMGYWFWKVPTSQQKIFHFKQFCIQERDKDEHNIFLINFLDCMTFFLAICNKNALLMNCRKLCNCAKQWNAFKLYFTCTLGLGVNASLVHGQLTVFPQLYCTFLNRIFEGLPKTKIKL